ncbi:hypothetical protein ASE90_01940 [Sphingomonas sp. Leaf67]|nr:hypothetical protein ASE90_01940 [Sphingomonas sp. Leaf67]
MLLLPRRGALAGTQADDHITDARRLTGLERQVAGFAVALVEQADHRDPLGHRRRSRQQAAVQPGIDAHHLGRIGIGTHRFGHGDLGGGGPGPCRLPMQPLPAEPAPDRQHYRNRQPGQPAAWVHASGLHAS